MQAPYFTVVGPCTIDGACVRSPNYPSSNYDNNEYCTITPTSLAVGQLLSATNFTTESGYDFLTVNNVPYSGPIGPSGVLLGSAFTWTSHSSANKVGWQVCAAPPGTVQHSDCNGACGASGLSGTGAVAVEGSCYGCWTPSGTNYNCPAGTEYRYDGNGYWLERDKCCNKHTCTTASPPPPPLAPPSPQPPPATARSVALGVGYCRDASGNNPWSTSSSCLDTVQECGQACEATTDCACFAHTSPTDNPENSDGCSSAGNGRCNLYIGPFIATQSSGRAGYIAHRLDPPPRPPPSPSPPPPLPLCTPGCPSYWIADNYCDSSCNVPECNYDEGDCNAYPSPPSAGCACDTISVVLSGGAYTTQSSLDGQYVKTSTTQDGRAVYSQKSSSSYFQLVSPRYLFFWATSNAWLLGPDYTSGSGWLYSTSFGNTQCPEAEGDSWVYWDGTAWQSGGVEVKCPASPPPPPSPSPPPPLGPSSAAGR